MGESYCAQIVGGVVTQVIVCANAEWAATHLGGQWVSTNGQQVSVGWVYDGERFTRPYEPPVEVI